MSNQTVRSIYLLPSAQTDTGVMDVGQVLSRTNHRLYRQGRNYCQRINVDPDSTKQYDIYALRDDWMFHNAWKLTYQSFLNNHKEEMQALSQKGGMARWFDFRINDGITVGAEMRPVRMSIASTGVVAGNAVAYGEFAYSQLYAEDGSSRSLNMQPTVAGVSYGLLHEYDKIGNPSIQPSTAVTTVAFGEVDNDAQDAAITQLSDEGNSPPYSTTGLDYSHPWLKIATIGGVSGTQKLSTGYFNAPCGLIVIKPTSGFISADDLPELSLEMKPGKYKGVHGPAMGTAKLVKGTYEVN